LLLALPGPADSGVDPSAVSSQGPGALAYLLHNIGSAAMAVLVLLPSPVFTRGLSF